MINHLINEIGGIGVFGVISICLFFAVFSASIVFAIVQKKTYLKSMGTLPLEDGTTANLKKGNIPND